MSNSTRNVDVAIIGAGTAGLSARRAAKAAGASVLMVDPGPFGTTCARVGCMPSKLLIAAADAAHHARHTEPFGVLAGPVRVDGPAVMRRVRSERDRFVSFVEDSIDGAIEAQELLVGRARIAGPGSLAVTTSAGEVTVEFERLVIAAGGAPIVPAPYRGLERFVLTNEEVFEIEDLPESVLVVGLGVIGLELGQALHRLGVRTTLLGMGGMIGPLSDPEVLESARRTFGEELDLHPQHELVRAEERKGRVRVEFVDSSGRTRTELFDRIVMAAGRRSNLHALGVEALGVVPDAHGRFPIDPSTLQLGSLPVFVAGDVNELHPLLHEAADDGRIAGQNAARFPQIEAPSRRTPLGIVFSEPQIAMVGRAWRSLDHEGTAVGAVDYDDQGRARVARINAGRARIYADRATHELLGAELFGPRAEHLAHLLAWAVQQRMTVDAALEMPFYHPVIEEGIRTALRDLSRALSAPGDAHERAA